MCVWSSSHAELARQDETNKMTGKRFEECGVNGNEKDKRLRIGFKKTKWESMYEGIIEYKI